MSRLTTQLLTTVAGLRGPGLTTTDLALIEGATNDAMRAAGFAYRSDAIAFAPKMATGTLTTVHETDTGTHTAVTGEVRLDGTAAVAGEQLPNEGGYTKQASGALWRTRSTDRQQAALQAAAAQYAVQAVTPFTELGPVLGSRVKALKLVEDTSNGLHYAYSPVSVVSGNTYTARFVVKAAGRTFLGVTGSGVYNLRADFDLAQGIAVPTGAATAGIKSLGHGYYECTVSQACTSSGTINLQIRLNTGLTAGAAVNRDGDGVSGQLIAGVNFFNNAAPAVDLLASSQISDPSWIKQGASVATVVTTNAPVAADVEVMKVGSAPLLMIEDSASNAHVLYRSVSWTTGKVQRAWAVVKPNGRTKVSLFNNGAGLAPFDCQFDLTTGTVSNASAGVVGSMVKRDNGSYLIQATKTATGTGSGNFQIRMLDSAGATPYQGDNASGIAILEAGWDEDGASVMYADAAALLTSTWLRIGLSSLAPSTTIKLGGLPGITKLLDALAANATGSLLTGLRWTAMGTSQTAQETYTTPLATLSGMVKTNVGVSGAKFSSSGDSASNIINSQVANVPANAQIVTIEGLINDFVQNAVLGALGDTTLSTFHGALYATWKAVAAKAPNAVIVFIQGTAGGGTGSLGPTTRAGAVNTLGLTPRDYQEAMRIFCEAYGTLMIQLGQRVGINDVTGNRMLVDGLHYNTAVGGPVVARYVNDDLQQMARRGMLL